MQPRGALNFTIAALPNGVSPVYHMAYGRPVRLDNSTQQVRRWCASCAWSGCAVGRARIWPGACFVELAAGMPHVATGRGCRLSMKCGIRWWCTARCAASLVEGVLLYCQSDCTAAQPHHCTAGGGGARLAPLRTGPCAPDRQGPEDLGTFCEAVRSWW